MQRVISRQNPRLRELSRLIASSRERRKQGRCVLEGEHLIQVYEERHGAPDTVVINEEALDRHDTIRALGSRHPSRTLIVPPRLFGELAVLPEEIGILAVVPTPSPRAEPGADFCLLLEDVQDPGNVGSMLRTAAAAGVKEVLMSKHCAFAWSPKVLRAGQGAHFLLDIHQDVELVEFTDRYRKNGDVVAAVASAGDELYELDLRGHLAVAIGNEGAGISGDLLERASRRVTIPMPGRMESLNAAAAAAVILFECVRQRLNQNPL